MTSMWTYPGLQPVSCDDRTRVQEIPLATVRITICGEPPVAMIWNPDLAPTLHPDKVRRWFNGGGIGGTGGSTQDWDDDQVAEFVRLLCIVHHGPSIDKAGHRVRLREDCGEFFEYMKRQKLRYDREVLLHWFALKFINERANDDQDVLRSFVLQPGHRQLGGPQRSDYEGHVQQGLGVQPRHR